MRASVPCFLLCLVVTGLSVVQAVAAPEVVAYHLRHGSDQCLYAQKACVTVANPGGDFSDLAVEVRPPGDGAMWSPAGQCSWWDDQQQGMVYTWTSCQHAEQPAVGRYGLRVLQAGLPVAELATEPTTGFPKGPVQITSPRREQVVISATPLITWRPYTFPGDRPGTPGADLEQVLVDVFDESCLIAGENGDLDLTSRDATVRVYATWATRSCRSGPEIAKATSWQYDSGNCWCCSPASLTPGRAYSAMVVLSSVGHAMGEKGWYSEMAASEPSENYHAPKAPFAVAGPVPQFESVRLDRGMSVFPDGTTLYGQYCAVLGADAGGADRLKFEVQDPDGLLRKHTEATVTRFGDGVFTAGEFWWAGQMDQPLSEGTYLVSITDSATKRTVSSEYSVGPLFAPTVITAPANGSVVSAAPTFAWISQIPADTRCGTQVWVEEIPGDGSGTQYWWIGHQFGTFPDGHIVWSVCDWGNDTLEYNADGSGEPLQSGRSYRLHVMANYRDGDTGAALEAMVDFTVQ
jgi:hypothetical protein